MLSTVLESYGLNPAEWTMQPFGTGLINYTWILKKQEPEYILQKINDNVFKNPYAISNNIRLVGNYLKQHHPDYLFVTPIRTVGDVDIVEYDNGYYRLFPFIKNSVTYTTVETPDLAFEAARQFAKFTSLLSNFNENELQETLPDFHNLGLRYHQYKLALERGNKERLAEAFDVVHQLEAFGDIVQDFDKIKTMPACRKRVMHHDTKISNLLFNHQNKGICIIDLDTMMPGYFISDVGDMMRTYLAAVSEEEKDFAMIDVREDYFAAIVEGYLTEMHAELSEQERNSFIYAGKFMIYMQAIRFLTDYLMNDVYYGASYEGQNFVRAVNQLHLLKRLAEKEQYLLQKIKPRKYFLIDKDQR